MSIATVIRDGAVFLTLSEDLLDQGYAVRFRAAGTSMQPAIEDGDTITVARVDLGGVKRGDILLYRSQRRTIAHRVVDIRTTGNKIAAVILRGDAKAACDAPVAPDRILGKVVAIEPCRRRAANTWRSRLARWWRVRGRSLSLLMARSAGLPIPRPNPARDAPRI